MKDPAQHGSDGNPAAEQQICPGCSQSFHCGMASGRENCWCMTLPAILPATADAQCLCESCLREAIDALDSGKTASGP
jgi:hypothetical protein